MCSGLFLSLRQNVRFIGATTYEEYKKHFEKSKSLVRRFQNIDITAFTESLTASS